MSNYYFFYHDMLKYNCHKVRYMILLNIKCLCYILSWSLSILHCFLMCFLFLTVSLALTRASVHFTSAMGINSVNPPTWGVRVSKRLPCSHPVNFPARCCGKACRISSNLSPLIPQVLRTWWCHHFAEIGKLIFKRLIAFVEMIF